MGRAMGMMTMLAALLAVTGIPAALANNEIVNFGPIMCAADEFGHLQDRAGRRVSKDWPVLRPSTGPKLFTLDPYREADVWLALAIVPEHNNLVDVGLEAETIESIRNLATDAFPLLSNDVEDRQSPRDRWLKNVVPQIKWHLWQRRFSFRVDWPANWPIKVSATVHDAASMLAAGKVSWQANEHTVQTHRRSADDGFDAPRWPCPRLYVHLRVEDDVVPLPPRRTSGGKDEVKGVTGAIYRFLVSVGEWHLGPLTNERLRSDPTDTTGAKSMAVPVNLVLEPVYLGFVPHTALGLLGVLVPSLLLVYFLIGPTISRAFIKAIEEEMATVEKIKTRKDR